MTISEAHTYFDLLADNIGSPKFSSTQKDVWLSQASIEYVKELFPGNEGGVVNVELDQNVYTNIHTLVYSLDIAYSNTVTLTAIQNALNTASSSTEPWMYILGVALTRSSITYPVKYVKQNNWNTFERNVFKKGTSTDPKFRFDSQSLKFSPAQTISGTPLNIVVVKQPKAVNLSGAVTIELPAHTHKAVVEKAVQLSSIGTRDFELAQLNK